MPNPYGVPEISVEEVARKRESNEPFVLLDVREPVEVETVSLGEGVSFAPLSRLTGEREAALPDEVRDDKEVEIVVFCHTGVRSAQVGAWLRRQGWTDVWNMEGGVEAYAVRVDPSIGRY